MKFEQELIQTKLFEQQLGDWPLAKENYALLGLVLHKQVDCGGMVVEVQFNPERVRSAIANVCRPESEIKHGTTTCFLCPENRPSEQVALSYSPEVFAGECKSLLHSYDILLNPYPIFPKHLTIPDKCHLPQLTEGRIGDFLSLAKDLSNFSLLYNGAHCGASIPGHQHFQAIERNVLPLEKESSKKRSLVSAKEAGAIYHFPGYLRKVFLLESDDRNWMHDTFNQIKKLLPVRDPQEKEPRFNLTIQYNEPLWQLYIFPRTNHRPAQFFETDEKQLLTSPGVVDMSGVFVTVREADFNKLDKELLRDIYRQVTISDEEELQIIRGLNTNKDETR